MTTMNESNLVAEEFIIPHQFSQNLEDLIKIIVELCDKLAANSDLGELIEETVHLIQQDLKYDQVILYLTDREYQHFTSKVMVSANHDQIIHSDSIENEISLAQRAAQQNCPIRIHDLKREAPEYYQAEPGDIQSELHIPLESDNEVIGVLSLRSRESNVFGEYEVLALKILVAKIALLIQKTRKDQLDLLFHPKVQLQETDQYPAEVDFNVVLPNIQDLAGIRYTFNEMVDRLVNEFGYTGAMLAVIDETGQNLPLQAMKFASTFDYQVLLNRIEDLLNFRVLGSFQSLIYDKEALGVQACLSGETKISHDLYDLFRPVVNQKLCNWLQKASGIKTCISIPLMVKDRALGNLYVATTEAEISNDDRQKLLLFADSAAIALKFEQLNEGLRQQVFQLTQLRNIERTISYSLDDIEKVLERILQGALELTQAEYGHVVLVGRYTSYLINRVSYPKATPFHEGRLGITQWIVRDRKPIRVDDIEEEKLTNESIKNLVVEHSKIRSHLGVPIWWRRELVGVINIGSSDTNAFNDLSQLLLEQIATQAAIAIANNHHFKEQQEMQKKLASVEQVIAMGDMASNMMHNLNNWVGSIRANAIYLLPRYKQGQFDQDQSTDILNDMLENAKKTLSLAKAINSPFIKQQFLEEVSEEIDINSCISNALDDNQIENLTQLELIKHLEEGLPKVVASQQLESVFGNLLSNALQAMNNQGILELRTRTSNDGRWVEVLVTDSGPGLSDHIAEDDIFKMGITSRDGGLGFGLWWCDIFLKRWGGDIQLAKSTRAGCKFLVRLPSINYTADSVMRDE